MKKLLVGIIAAAIASSAAVAGSSDYVYVKFGDMKEKFRTGEVGEASVCTLKKMVADKFDLEMKKFDLVKSGRRLDENKTLAADHVYSTHTVDVKPNGYSTQCS